MFPLFNIFIKQRFESRQLLFSSALNLNLWARLSSSQIGPPMNTNLYRYFQHWFLSSQIHRLFNLTVLELTRLSSSYIVSLLDFCDSPWGRLGRSCSFTDGIRPESVCNALVPIDALRFCPLSFCLFSTLSSKLACTHRNCVQKVVRLELVLQVGTFHFLRPHVAVQRNLR